MSQSKANSTKPRRSCQQSPVLWPVLWLCVKISECVPTSYRHSPEVVYSCLYGIDEEAKGDEVIFHCVSACIEEYLGCRSQSPPSYPQWQAVSKVSRILDIPCHSPISDPPVRRLGWTYLQITWLVDSKASPYPCTDCSSKPMPLSQTAPG